jgi:hypothetical protein
MGTTTTTYKKMGAQGILKLLCKQTNKQKFRGP